MFGSLKWIQNVLQQRTTSIGRAKYSRHHGRPQKIFQGGKVEMLLRPGLFDLLTIQRKWTYTRRFTLSTPQRKRLKLRQQLQTGFSLYKHFYTEQMFVLVCMVIQDWVGRVLNELQALRIIRISTGLFRCFRHLNGVPRIEIGSLKSEKIGSLESEKSGPCRSIPVAYHFP